MTKKKIKTPKVAILLATYNGEKWIREQLNSILIQKKINYTVFISDDNSSDSTKKIIKEYQLKNNNIEIVYKNSTLRSSAGNFFHLITNINIKNYDYFAFCDQDDIWLPNKLFSQYLLLNQTNAEGVSSDVIAFWPNGKEKLIIKSYNQTNYDYLFESSGPGCSFLISYWLMNKVRYHLMDKFLITKVYAHDWFVYLICRSYEKKWIISSQPTLKYRQHNNNLIGANVGISRTCERFKRIKNSWYRNQVLYMSKISFRINKKEPIKKLIANLERKSLKNQFNLLLDCFQFRRKKIDKFFLFFLILFYIF